MRDILYLKYPETYTSYPVQPGDTVYSIAKVMYGFEANANALISENNLTPPYNLVPGRLLSINRNVLYDKQLQQQMASDAPALTIRITEGQQYPIQQGSPPLNQQSWLSRNRGKVLLGIGAVALLIGVTG